MTVRHSRTFLPLLLLVALLTAFTLGLDHPRPTRAQNPSLTLSQSDNNTTQTVSVGTTITLSLTGDNLDWKVSNSGDSSVLAPLPMPLSPAIQGIWSAVAPGRTSIEATGTPHCNPGAPCPLFIASWQATIVVTGGGGSGSSTSVTYPAGWNLVGGPDGSAFPVALFAWDGASGQYRTIAAGQTISGGRGYWAYFNGPASITFTSAGGGTATVPASAGQWTQIADPSATQSANVSGADVTYTYDPGSGTYASSSTLHPGQGAWAYSSSGAAIQLMVAPPPLPGQR